VRCVRDALDAIVMKALERNRDRRYRPRRDGARSRRGRGRLWLALEEIVAFIASVEADLREGSRARARCCASAAARSGSSRAACLPSNTMDGPTVRDHAPLARTGHAPRPARLRRDRRSTARRWRASRWWRRRWRRPSACTSTSRPATRRPPRPPAAVVQCGDLR